MRDARQSGNCLMKQSPPSVQKEKACIVGVKLGIDDFLDGGQVDRHVFDADMVSLHQQSRDGQNRQKEEISNRLKPDDGGILYRRWKRI